jgi:GNAT superfamily N-acetyltransferase
MPRVEVESAQPSDAPVIAKVFAGSIDTNFVLLVPHGCFGAAEFIRMQVTVPESVAESVYLVAREQKVVIGAAEMRRSSDGLFLNNIAVHLGHRGKGTGAALLAAGLALWDRKSGNIALDSLEGNDRAENWYRRLGFVTTQCTEFAEVSPPRQAAGHSLWLSGLPQAELAQQQFGFSSFTIHTPAPVSVGRIGGSWFRLTDPEAVRDPAVFETLRAFDANRRFLAVLRGSVMPAEQRIRVLARLHRMEASIPQVLARLAEPNAKPETRLTSVSS